MCRLPVTLGGGIMMQKVSSRLAFAPARKAPVASHCAAMRASASAALKVLSIVIGRVPRALAGV